MLAVVAACAATAGAQDLPTVPETPTVPESPAGSDPTAPGGAADDALDQPGSVGPDGQTDTDYTPAPEEDTELWTQVGGAAFGETAPIGSSPTEFETDLYAVAFRNEDRGFAAGAVCAEGVEREPGDSDESYGLRVKGCDRVPVIYRFTNTPVDGPRWEEVYRGSSSGYVGGIAWIDSNRAVAVGGDGVYPRREEGFRTSDPNETYETWRSRDPAGAGRAWVFDARTPALGWRELREDEGTLPEGTRGMTALAFHPGASEFGAAGAMGQIVEWEDGGFTRIVDAQSEPGAIADGQLLRYRVRDLTFIPQETPQAFGATAGCCGPTPGHDRPFLVAYDGNLGRWSVKPVGWQNLPVAGGTVAGATPNPGQELPDSAYSITASRGGVFGYRASVLATPGGPQRPGERPSVNSQTQCIDSQGAPDNIAFFLFYHLPLDPVFEYLRQSINSARLVDGDGDAGKSFALTARSEAERDRGEWKVSPNTVSGSDPWCTNGTENYRGDSVPDWQVGELRSTTRPGLGARALAVASHLDPSLFPEVIRFNPESRDPSTMEPGPSDLLGGYQPTTQEKLAAYLGSSYFLLPTYSLNAISVIGDTGSGWAVGDRGAILRLGEESLKENDTEEPDPPTLGSRQLAPAADSSPYRGLAPEAHRGPPGPVPALSARPTQQLAEPAMFPAGSPDPTRSRDELVEDVSAIVMSRNGREGWAIGPSRQANPGATRTSAPTLYRFDGSAWSRCDPVGTPGVVPPDPACEALAPLREFREPSGSGGIERRAVRLLAAARVPLEADGDPSNDDEFEVVATGTGYAPDLNTPKIPVILRYADGRWSFEDSEAREAVSTSPTSTQGLTAVAFGSPDSGWMLRTDHSGLGDHLFHYDGERWMDCGPTAADCDGGEGRGSFAAGGSDGNFVRGLVSAGRRVFMYGYRVRDNQEYPMVLYRDPGDSGWSAAGGGLDPGFDEPGAAGALRGRVESLSVDPSNRAGWAVSAGGFSAGPGAPATRLLRLSDGGWEPFPDRGPIADYLTAEAGRGTGGMIAAQLTLDSERAIIAQGLLPEDAGSTNGTAGGRIFALEDDSQSWRLLEAGRPKALESPMDGAVQALAPDGSGGFWAAIRNENRTGFWDQQTSHVWFYHYTDRPPEPVFSETPNPIQGDRRVTALAASGDGTVWLGTDSDTLYRYDRVAGWEAIRVPGWDPGRVVTRSSEVTAIAVGPDGEGLAVGDAGRIARVTPAGAVLDRAAGTACHLTGDGAPCGTGRQLSAAAIAPDGSAMIGGERLTLLWRPAGGDFRAIQPPRAASTAGITGIAMPEPGMAWVTTGSGLLFEGQGSEGGWTWRLDNVDQNGDLISTDQHGVAIPLRAIALDENRHGYAVGDRGLVLERTGEDGAPWRRVRGGFLDDLTAVTVAPRGGDALIGGRNDLILTASGPRLEVARPADYPVFPEVTDPGVAARTKRIVGMALVPGLSSDQAEAWAASDAILSTNGASRLLHFTSDPEDPLLDPGGRAEPLPDSPPAREGELSFAVFGKTDCAKDDCTMQGSSESFETRARVVADAISERRARPGGPQFAVFTGDATGSAADPGSQASEGLRRWSELVVDRLAEAGVPVFGAIGVQDLSRPRACQVGGCLAEARAGDNLAWRAEMGGRPAPWGRGPQAATEGVRFEPAPDPGGGPSAEVVPGGARTHYAVDLLAGDGDAPLARIVFADTALGSLSGGEGLQEPVEGSGQAAWLERMVCVRGSGNGASCTRGPDQPAIVVTNTPTYSYGPGTVSDTQADATLFESILMRNGVEAVVSGRLGWNALYWATAPGVHEPCPGGAYPSETPEPGSRDCEGATPEPGPTPGLVADDPLAGDVSGLLPVIVAASAGEGFGPDGRAQGGAANGYWHGYTVVRLARDEDGAKRIVVEQRPVFDWVRLTAARHVLRARSRLKLQGEGREVIGPTLPAQRFASARFDEINSRAITHRFDLLVADPARPWLPSEGTVADQCDPYDCLSTSIGTIDGQSGEVEAGNGQYPRTFAVAQLSAGEHAATYPLVFEPRASYRTPPAPPPAPVSVPPPAAPPAPAQPTTPSVNLPAAPVLPVLSAQALAPPPAPPVPPTFASQAPLDLNVSPASLDVAAPSAVTQPPTPPVNPAPPSGARREARQRQAAAQKSGADSDQESSEAGEGGGDLAQSSDTVPGSSGMTRNDFTAVAHREQPSAWARDALLGGGLGLAALLLAIGVRTARPTPRRREPELPAPAWARSKRR